MEKEKVKFYKSKWFMWLCLILLPPVGIVLLWLFHKDMKKITRIMFTIIFAFWCLILIAFASADTSDMQSNPDTTTQQTTQSETSTTESTTKATTTAETTTKPTTQATTKSKLETEGISFHISNVRNDVTGNWRIALIAENIQMQDYAVDYYNEYFKDDKEIHAIVNFNYKTTTKLSVVGDSIDVTVYEYVDKEEHDAKKLFSGMLLKEYFVNIKTGEIEEKQ